MYPWLFLIEFVLIYLVLNYTLFRGNLKYSKGFKNQLCGILILLALVGIACLSAQISMFMKLENCSFAIFVVILSFIVILNVIIDRLFF